MDFPHLRNATTFPDTDTRVYEQYRNVFDYNVWTPNTVIKLCRVNWYDDYHDVVKFTDDIARDTWFDKLDGETVKLTTNMYIARADADGIKLPVPYMTAHRCGYYYGWVWQQWWGYRWQECRQLYEVWYRGNRLH